MYRNLSLFSTLLLLISNSGIVEGLTCAEIQAKIDNKLTLDDVFEYLSLYVPKQSELVTYFQCLGGNVQRNPIDLNANSSRSFIFGDGRMWQRSYSKLLYFNYLQNEYQSRNWAGKIFNKTSDGTVKLLNVKTADKHLISEATVYNNKSIVDGADCVILDYRNDNTHEAGDSNGRIIKRCRDEIREVIYRGAKSSIYLGRVTVFFYPRLNLVFTSLYDQARSYFFYANFLLDFRPKKQSLIPSWALVEYE